MLIIQVSPYPPEPGSEYHEQLVHELVKATKMPVIVLAGLMHLNVDEAFKAYGVLEKYDGVLVYRAFWAPRVSEYKKLCTILKYVIYSLKALASTVRVAKRYVGQNKVIVHFHYGPTTWPGAFLGEHYPLGMLLARLMGVKVIWTVHAFLLPYQLRQEIKDRGLPSIVTLPLIAYYFLLAKVVALSCNKIIVLVDSPQAPITNYLRKLFGDKKVVEQVHPPFKWVPTTVMASNHNKVVIACLGYIRKEKGYHHLLEWLVSLKNRNPELYSKIEVIIVGSVDRKRLEDILYLKDLIQTVVKHKLYNVKFILKKLSKREFAELLIRSTIVWCAYRKKYGPSGILAWAKTYKKRVILLSKSDIWHGT